MIITFRFHHSDRDCSHHQMKFIYHLRMIAPSSDRFVSSPDRFPFSATKLLPPYYIMMSEHLTIPLNSFILPSLAFSILHISPSFPLLLTALLPSRSLSPSLSVLRLFSRPPVFLFLPLSPLPRPPISLLSSSLSSFPVLPSLSFLICPSLS